MRLHGYCTACRRIRLVQVTGIDLALTVARGVPRGICADCQKREDEDRRARARGRRA